MAGSAHAKLIVWLWRPLENLTYMLLSPYTPSGSTGPFSSALSAGDCLGQTPMVACEHVILLKHWFPDVSSCSILYTALPLTIGMVPLRILEMKRAHRFPSGNPKSCEHYYFTYVTGVMGKLWSGPAPPDESLDLNPWKLCLPLCSPHCLPTQLQILGLSSYVVPA